ncbi:MAG TPA: BPSS1780 family membrane protein [Burkholderiales bacterium]|nr:BPSS1780 family membrane protein [Burkholderiales bacterium]
MTTVNPYAAPKAAVADETLGSNADFVPGGQSRPAANGWTWIAEGWELFKRQPGMWIGMILLLLLIFIAAAFIPIVGGLAMTLFGPVFAAGVMVGCKALDSGEDLELSHLFAGFRSRTGTLIGVGALYLAATIAVALVVSLVMGVGMMTMMGGGDQQAMAAMGMTFVLAILIMLALLLPAMMAVWLAAPLVVFHDHGAIDAMKGSFTGCLKNVMPFLLYGVVLAVLSIVASLPLALGWLVLGPVFAASIYASYRDIYLKPRP